VATAYRKGYKPQQQQHQVLIASTEHYAAPKPPKGYRSAWKDDRLNPNRAGNGQVAAQPVVQPQPRISTRSAPAQPTLKRDVIRASVQVGVYRDKASAQSIARKVQRMGLPVRIGILNRGSEQLRLVLAGPFNSETGLNAALGKVQRAGYGSAVIRR
jgi:cell division protein FtsN